MKKPRLVHVTTIPEQLGYYRGQMRFMQERFEVVAVASPGPYLEQIAHGEGVEVHAIPMARRIAPLKDLVSLLRMLSLFRRLRPEIVHSTTPKAGLLGTLCARAVGAKAVLSVFGLTQMTSTGAMRMLMNAMTRLSCALAHRVWCDSVSIRDYLVANGLCNRRKIFVAGSGSVNGVDAAQVFNPDRFDQAERAATRETWSIPRDAFVLGFVGRIVRDKGIRELTQAWKILRDRHADLHLLIVGEFEAVEPIRPEDEALLKGDSRVHFTGRQNDMPRLFAIMNLYVMPSYREGFGITNIEAAAFAIPVVSTRIPGCVDSVTDGVTGTLVPPRDVETLVGAIEKYYRDPELRAEHGHAGRDRVLASFRPEQVWSDVLDEYLSLLSSRR